MAAQPTSPLLSFLPSRKGGCTEAATTMKSLISIDQGN
jgi:hypothetical protein